MVFPFLKRSVDLQRVGDDYAEIWLAMAERFVNFFRHKHEVQTIHRHDLECSALWFVLGRLGINSNEFEPEEATAMIRYLAQWLHSHLVQESALDLQGFVTLLQQRGAEYEKAVLAKDQHDPITRMLSRFLQHQGLAPQVRTELLPGLHDIVQQGVREADKHMEYVAERFRIKC